MNEESLADKLRKISVLQRKLRPLVSERDLDRVLTLAGEQPARLTRVAVQGERKLQIASCYSFEDHLCARKDETESERKYKYELRGMALALEYLLVAEPFGLTVGLEVDQELIDGGEPAKMQAHPYLVGGKFLEDLVPIQLDAKTYLGRPEIDIDRIILVATW